MKEKINSNLHAKLRKYLMINVGLNFTKNQDKELIRKISLASEEFNFSNTPDFINWLLDNNLNNQHIEKLACHLTIGETFFLREKKGLNFLEYKYLPDLIRQRKGINQNLRIWSAGCATGEEPYSVAILLKRIIHDIKNWDITILATDINSEFIKKAKKGIYTKWSFRNSPDWFMDNYFKKKGKNEFQIIPEIKKMVSFSYLNLAKDTYPSLINNTNAMDIILCRNVLIYFSPDGIRNVTESLRKSLLDNGILIVSPVEVSNLISPKFGRLSFNGLTIYKNGLIEDKTKKAINRRIQKTVQVSEQFTLKQDNGKNKIKSEHAKKVIQKNIIYHKNLEKNKIPENNNYEKALSLFKSGSYKKTEELLENFVAGNKGNLNSTYILLARTKANLGKLDEAREICEKVLSSDKLNHRMYYLLATILLEQGNDEKAISCLNRTIYLDQNFVLAHFLLGNISNKIKNNNSGRKHFTNAINILSNLKSDVIIPESEGITVGRFREILSAIKT